jgi:hypothetical protein
MEGLFDANDDAGLFDVQHKSKPIKVIRKDERAKDALKKRGLLDVAEQERLLRVVYYASVLPVSNEDGAKKISEVFDAHKQDKDFFTSTSMTSDLSKAKQVVHNFVYSNKGSELRTNYSDSHDWAKNFLAKELIWQKGDDAATRTVVLAATNIEPDKTTEVQRITFPFVMTTF